MIGKKQIVLILLALAFAMPMSIFAQAETAICEEGYRTFAHAMGESCIPEAPVRVVALDTSELDNALALGAVVVGAPVGEALGYQEYLGAQLDGISDTGRISEPNLEIILSLEPDLILGSKQRYEAVYAQLSEIGPVVLTESLRVPWQDNFLIHADALGKTAEAEQFLADYQAQIDTLQETLGDDLPTISVIRFRPGQVRLYLKSSYIGYILQDVGLPRPESQDQDVFSAEISLEDAQAIDADYIFITGYLQDDSDQDTFLNSPLWQDLSGVQAGRAIDVDDNTWIAGLGVQAVFHVLDDLYEILVPAFPVTIEHKFGSITLEEAPQRIVSIGFVEHDNYLALGVEPVAIRFFFGDENNAIFPWAEEYVTGDYPDTLKMDYGALNYEAILAYEPNLISAIGSGITEEEYNALSEIAPVLAQSDEYIDFGMPWQEALRLAGRAVGKSGQAESLVTEIEADLAVSLEQIAHLEGKTVAVAYRFSSMDSYGFYTDQDVRGRFFADLGLVVPDELIEIAGDSFYANVSSERLDLLDQDLLVFVGLAFAENGREGIESDPLLSQLAVAQEGRILYVPAEVDDAIQFGSVLSISYAIEGIIPELLTIFGEAK